MPHPKHRPVVEAAAYAAATNPLSLTLCQLLTTLLIRKPQPDHIACIRQQTYHTVSDLPPLFLACHEVDTHV